jgi:hypothetical protein
VTARASQAQESDKELPFKLTVGEHHFSQSGHGLDVNLRHTSELGTTWLGYFKAGDLDAHQSRAGWERWFGDSLRVLPSLQVASGGFVGGSVKIERVMEHHPDIAAVAVIDRTRQPSRDAETQGVR